MIFSDWVELFLFIFLVLILTPVIGSYLARIFTDKAHFIYKTFGWLEKLSYKIGRINPQEEMSWDTYAKALFMFNFFGFGFLMLLQMFQHALPMNPQNLPGVSWPLAFNTAMSFTTNTNWQAYAGENTLSYLSQMLGLTSANFLSAATGMAVFLALARGITRKTSETIGNFWVDLVRTTVYFFLPLSLLFSLFLVTQGVVQTLSPYAEVTTLENFTQTIPVGPVASQVAIKQLGSNGGGFFNANSSHPFENPNIFTNFLEMLAIILIPAACVYTYGILIGSKKHAWLLFTAMTLLWIGGLSVSLISEDIYNPVINAFPVLEGKESRFGTTNSIAWTVSTTATSNGSVNAMISSLSPLAGGVAMLNIMMMELIYGGVGVGICSMIMLTLLTVFLSGLMVGRTPEYLGKKIERKEILWVIMAIIIPGGLILVGSAISCMLPQALSSLANLGPHGLSEILYAFTSAAGNNGSSFAGLNANTTYYNLALGIVMLLGRAAIVLPSLAIAGSLAKKKITPPSVGTFSTNSLLFLILLLNVIFIISALTFFPALCLGPIVEHLLMLEGRSF